MIVTVARDEGLRLKVADALRDSAWDLPVSGVSSVGEVEDLVASAALPSVFIVGPDVGLAGAMDVVSAAAGLRVPTPVLLVADPTTETLRGAMRAGIRDVLPPDFEASDLIGAFEDAEVRTSGPPSIPGLTVAVFSAKGGVGTSVVASNLAARLGARTKQAVTLLDLDLASADQAIMHGMSPRWTVQDVANGDVGLEVDSLRQVLLEVSGTQVRLLPGPIDPALAETITAANVASLIAASRAEAPIAVLDTSSSFDDRTLAALDVADAIVVVSSLDVAALRALTVSLQTLRQLGIDEDRVDVTVVRSDSKSGLTISDVERAIDRPVDVGVPSTRAVPRSVNEGVPLAVSSPRSNVVGAIDELVDLVLRHAADEFDADGDKARGDDGGGILSGILPWSRSTDSNDTGARASASGDKEPGITEVESTGDSPGAWAASVDDEPVARTPAPVDDDETPEAQVLSLRDRSADSQSPGLRKVQRRRGESGQDRSVESSAENVETGSSDAPPPPEPPPLEAMPPPIVVGDDEDDQPRRRRRR